MMVDTAWAQFGPGGAAGLLANFFPLILVFFIFYFLLIRPQQKKAKEHKKMLDGMKRNDEVITAGGVYGRVMSMTDTVVTLEIAPNVRIRIQRSQVGALVKGGKVSEDGKEAKE
jgi:preprotein translocase subunit YajC